MKVNLALLKLVAVILLVVCAIMFFAKANYQATWGLFALAFASWAASDLKI